jgi:hypothetical protein
MSASDPDRPWRPRQHDDPDRLLNPFERTTEPHSSFDDEQRALGQIDELEDPQDPPDPSEASDPETVANANASK